MTGTFPGRTFRWSACVLATLLGLGSEAPAQEPEHAPTDSTLTLQLAVDLALEFHPSVRAARAAERGAAARAGGASAEWWPSLQADGSLFQYQRDMLVFPIHELSPDAFQFDRTLIQGGLQLGWTLFDGFGRSSRVKGAEAERRAAVAHVEASEAALLAEVSITYLEVLSARGILDAQLQSLAALAAERERVARLLDQGQAAEVEWLRVEAAYAEAEAERIAAAQALDTAERALARMLGVGVDATSAERLESVRLADTAADQDRAALLDRFEASNPDLAAARSMREAAERARGAASATWWPRFEVAGAYQLFTSPDLEFQDLWQIGLRLSYPLFTGGARSNAVTEAGAQASEAEERLELVRLRGHDAVDRALARVQEQSARVEALSRAAEHLVEVARIEQLALEAGRGTQTDYLRAEASVRRAQAAVIQARHAEIAARVELARTVGELTPHWLSTMLETVR
jgi:outer membrane protein